MITTYTERQDICPICKGTSLTELDTNLMESHGNDPTRVTSCDVCKFVWTEPRPQYKNYYCCDECESTWEDIWDCFCDCECPDCGEDYSPYKSEELDAVGTVIKTIEH